MKKKVQFRGQDIELGIGDELWINAMNLEKVSAVKVKTYLALPQTESFLKRAKVKVLENNGIWFPEKVALDYAKLSGYHELIRALILEHKPFKPEISIKNNKLMVSSLDVANQFVKPHKNILRDIENLECSEEFTRLNFEPSTYVDNQGVTQPFCSMTRDGFSFLVMGFTGKPAARFKEAYISAFNKMEAEIINGRNKSMIPDFGNPAESARAWADQYEARMIAEAKAEENKDKADAHDLLIEKADNYSLREVADLLGTGQNRFSKWLKENNYLLPSRLPYQEFIRAGYFVVKEVIKNETVFHTPMITPKGLEYFTKLRNKGKMKNILNEKLDKLEKVA